MLESLGLMAYALGAAAVAWVAAGYVGVSGLALAMTLLIGAAYLAAGAELWRFHRATSGLQALLAGTPASVPDLGRWLAPLHPSLQTPVRLRIEGERTALPGPAMTPFLVGLLVLLGMLGTFLGMVVTLKGAVLALESTTDLATIRAALAAPVKGLGVAFGTSVAGVAASAMLGLVSALCRRDRLQATQRLDTQIATSLRAHSLAHQREAMLTSLQQQGAAWPEVMAQLQATVAQLARQHQDLSERLAAGQDRFHGEAQAAYGALAASVDRSLSTSLAESARVAGAVLQPVVEATVSGMAAQTARFQQALAGQVQAQLEGLSGRFDTTVQTVAEVWARSLAEQQRQGEGLTRQLQSTLGSVGEGLAQQSAALLQTVDRAHATLQADAAGREAQRLATWTQGLEGLAAALQRDWQQAGVRAEAGQARVCEALERSGQALQAQADAQHRATLAEVARLIDTAAEAPRAAAELVGQLRDKLSDSMARDNGLLEERARIMATLGSLLDAVSRAAIEQRTAIDALVASSADVLQQVGNQFAERLEAESERMAGAAVQLGGSAIEVASLGEAFGVAVQRFSSASEAMTGQLQRIEAALEQSAARSDEQLGYYVAQAREIIDLSISSQRQIVDDLQRIAERPQPLAGAVA